MAEIKGKTDLDTVEPIKMTLEYNPMTQEVRVDTEENMKYSEMLGILTFAQMLIMTAWQTENAFVTLEEYQADHDFEDDDDDEE